MKIIKLTAVSQNDFAKQYEIYINENHIISFQESRYAKTTIYLTGNDNYSSSHDVIEPVDEVLKLLTQE